MRRAVIVGSEGQDGQLLYDFLLKKKYSIIGIDKTQIRCSLGVSFQKLDILKYKEVANLVNKFQPTEIYYLAAFHHSSENLPSDNVELMQCSYAVHVSGLLNFLEAVRIFYPKARIFYAASSHIFGEVKEKIQNENTPINPNCIYGITKAAGLALCKFYRSRYGIFSSVGILYNHESVLREGHFVSKKIIKGAIDIKKGRINKLILGDFGAVIDWGYAPDYVRAMYLILQSEVSNDFIVSTGKPHTVLDFVKVAFDYFDLDWKLYVKEDSRIVCKQNFFRVGNPMKLIKSTGWKPEVKFKDMIKIIINQELDGVSLK